MGYSKDGVHKSLPLNFFKDRNTEAYASKKKLSAMYLLVVKRLLLGVFDGFIAVAIAIAVKKSYL